MCLLFANSAWALAFTDIKFGTKQMGDSSSWNVYNCVYTNSCTAGNISNVGSMRNGNGQNFTLGATQYMKFSYTNSVVGEPWTITVYNANGSVATVLGTYRIINAGNGYFMTSNQPHPNAGNGTLWSTQVGMVSMAPAVTFTGTPQPTQAQMNNLADSYYSPDPIYVSGQTYTPPVALAPVYSSGISSAQLLRKSNNQSTYSQGHAAIVDINGNDNEISIQQINGTHYASVSVTGNSNSADILQTTSTNSRHYLELGITGSNNNATIAQRDTDKTAFVNINGSNNTLSVNQKDTGNHYLNLSLNGDGHTASVVQEGSGNHQATVELTNGGGVWNFQLNQLGTTGQTYSLPHSMTDGSTVSGTCYTAAGCNLSVNQQ